MATPAHLGGHQGITWVDEPVLDYLIGRYGIRSMLDVGCGPGGMVDVAETRGVVAVGIDGDPSVERPNIFIHDFTTGPCYLAFDRLIWERTVRYDLIWCCEFVEHVEAQYQENYLATFDAGRVLYLTAAYPGQGGHHHVNEQSERYWIELLARHGWTEDIEATRWVRAHGATPFAKMTGMVFVRSSSQP